MPWLKCIVVFAVVASTDAAWAEYLDARERGRAMIAACWAAGMTLLGAINVLQYTLDRRVIGAAVLGAFVGTYLAVRRRGRRPTTRPA